MRGVSYEELWKQCSVCSTKYLMFSMLGANLRGGRKNGFFLQANERSMNKILKVCILVSLASLLSACDDSPMKPGGGGLPQTYDPGTGRYN